MNNILDKTAKIVLIVLLFVSFGCTAAKTVQVSSPESEIMETDRFNASIVPNKRTGENFYSSFMLTIENKSHRDMVLNWNETRYSHNRENESAVVFEGVEPSQVKQKTIPDQPIAPNSSFSQRIFPLSKIARANAKSRSHSGEKSGIFPGILPNGLNSILIAVEVDGKTIKKTLSVTLKAQAQ